MKYREEFESFYSQYELLEGQIDDEFCIDENGVYVDGHVMHRYDYFSRGYEAALKKGLDDD